MTQVKEAIFAAACAREQVEPELCRALGICMFVAMAEVERMEMLAGPGLYHTYHTYFPMPDGQFWQLSLAKREEAADV